MKSFGLYLFDTSDNHIKCVLSFHLAILMYYNLASICSISFIYFKSTTWTGVLMGNKVRCPWHGACFNTKTGDIEEFPGLDSLPTYKVISEGIDFVRYMPPPCFPLNMYVFCFIFLRWKLRMVKFMLQEIKRLVQYLLDLLHCHIISIMWYTTKQI